MTSLLALADRIGAVPGFDPPSPRWRATLAFFAGLPLTPGDVSELCAATRRPPTCVLSRAGRPFRELWCRVGRRGRKSSTAALIALHEACFGGHEEHLMPGERGLVAIVSRDIAGSTSVARMVESFATALGITSRWTSMGSVRLLELDGFAFAVACLPCSATAPRGYAIPVVVADEIAHWQTDADAYADADTAVLAAIRPAMAQFPRARLVAISSPLGHEGIFHTTLEEHLDGSGLDDVLAVEGPTWAWSPDVTEARTHAIEPDPETHAREFGAVPSASEGTAFVGSDVLACFVEREEVYVWGQPFMLLDPAKSVDSMRWFLASWGTPSPIRVQRMIRHPSGAEVIARDDWGRIRHLPSATKPLLRIFEAGGWTGEELQATDMEAVAAELARIADAAGAQTAFSDQYGDVFLAALLSRHGLRLRSFAHSATSKHEAVTLIRLLMRDRQLSIFEHEGLRRDLLGYPRRIVGGGFRYGERRSGQRHHWDYASCLVTLGHALLEERGTPTDKQFFDIDGAPTKRASGKKEIVPGR